MRSQGPASHWIPWTWTHVVSRKQLRIAASKLSSASSACLLRYIELCEDQAMSFIQGLFGLGHGRRCFGPFCQTQGHLSGSGGMHAWCQCKTPQISAEQRQLQFDLSRLVQQSDISQTMHHIIHACWLETRQEVDRSQTKGIYQFTCLRSKPVSLDCHYHIV